MTHLLPLFIHVLLGVILLSWSTPRACTVSVDAVKLELEHQLALGRGGAQKSCCRKDTTALEPLDATVVTVAVDGHETADVAPAADGSIGEVVDLSVGTVVGAPVTINDLAPASSPPDADDEINGAEADGDGMNLSLTQLPPDLLHAIASAGVGVSKSMSMSFDSSTATQTPTPVLKAPERARLRGLSRALHEAIPQVDPFEAEGWQWRMDVDDPSLASERDEALEAATGIPGAGMNMPSYGKLLDRYSRDMSTYSYP